MSDRAVGAVWADFTGRTRLTIIKAATNPCTILTKLQGHSNAGVLYNWDGPLDAAIGTSTAAIFQAANQAATLVFETGVGSLLRVTLPAPDASIFLPDGKTVDAAAIADVIAACVGELSDGAGNVATGFVGGFLAPTANDLTPIG
jgi:hypothetical protein